LFPVCSLRGDPQVDCEREGREGRRGKGLKKRGGGKEEKGGQGRCSASTVDPIFPVNFF